MNARRLSFLFLIVIFLLVIWYLKGYSSFTMDIDFGRDLYELSNIWLRKVVFLGPRLSTGFQTSPVYYYLFFPGLLISGGKASSLLISNWLLAGSVLVFFAGQLLKKTKNYSFFIVLTFGLMPYWCENVFHPGNGFTYVFWIFLSLTLLYFNFPLFLPVLFFGLAFSYHPAAILVLPVFIYEYWQKRKKLKEISISFFAFLVAWLPIITFEIITKGLLTRNFLAKPSSGLKFAIFNFENIKTIAHFLGLNIFLFIIIYTLGIFFAEKRQKIWFLCSFFILILLCFIAPVYSYYLLGITALISFVLLTTLIQKKFGVYLIIFFTAFLFFQYISLPKIQSARPIRKLEMVVEGLVAKNKLDKTKKIAVVEALALDNAVPQADDYRFFLRMKGYNVPEVQQYSQADVLLMFIEEPKFNWKNWSTWEIEQTNCHKIFFDEKINGVEVIALKRY